MVQMWEAALCFAPHGLISQSLPVSTAGKCLVLRFWVSKHHMGPLRVAVCPQREGNNLDGLGGAHIPEQLQG